MQVAMGNTNVLIESDINTKSVLWGSPTPDQKGEYWDEWMAQCNQQVMNNKKPTFERGTPRSHIDVTLAGAGLSTKIIKWDVLDEQVFTYHKFIQYEIGNKVFRLQGRTEVYQ